MSRFKVQDRVTAMLPDLSVQVEGVIRDIVDGAEDSDLAEVKFLVEYDTEVGGRTEGFHCIHELRLVHGDYDKAPPAAPKQASLPTLSDYKSKVLARVNTTFDALFCKGEIDETWLCRVTPKGQFLLQHALKGMTLRDISELYAELSGEVFSLMILGREPQRLEAYRSLAHEIFHAVLVHGCYQDYDGKGAERFQRMMVERPRRQSREEGTEEGG